jgi:hypothetical protein
VSYDDDLKQKEARAKFNGHLHFEAQAVQNAEDIQKAIAAAPICNHDHVHKLE